MRKLIVLAVMLTLVVSASGCGIVFVGDGWNFQNYTGDWSDTYNFDAGKLTVAGVNGNIAVEIWDKNEVQAEARWTAKTATYQFSPEVEESQGALSLTLPSDRELSGVSWTVKVPQGLDLVIRTSNGRVYVSGEGYGAVKVNTSNGRVNLDGSGTGELNVNTSNGSVDIQSWIGEVDISTSNGSITANLGKISEGRYSLTTSNGTIRVHLEDDSTFDLTASTSNGKINNELNGTWSKLISGNSHDGLYNGGGARLILRTSNSNIWLHRR